MIFDELMLFQYFVSEKYETNVDVDFDAIARICTHTTSLAL